VHDGPVLEVRDYLLDHPADLVDSGVELFLPVKQFAVRWFPEWRDHFVADVALVAYPVPRVQRAQHVRLAQAVVIVATSVDGSEIQASLP